MLHVLNLELEWVYLLHMSSLNIIECFREDIRYVETMNTLCYNVCGISSEPSCKVSQRMQAINIYWKSAMCFAKPLCLSETYTKAYVDSAFWLSEIFFQCNERYMKALVFFQALPMWSPKDERSVRALHVLNSSSSCFRARDCIFLSSASRVWMMMTYSNLLCLWLWSVLMRDGYLLSAFGVVTAIFRKRYRHPSFVRHWFFGVAILTCFDKPGDETGTALEMSCVSISATTRICAIRHTRIVTLSAYCWDFERSVHILS